MRALLDITDAAYYLHMSTDALRDLIKHRQVPYLQRQKKIYLAVADLDAWIAALRVVEVEEAVKAIRVPAHFTDLRDSIYPEEPPETLKAPAAMPFTRGARRQVSAPSVIERNQ